LNLWIGLSLAPLLGGCAAVVVHVEGAPPKLSLWPLGVRIERGQAAAVSVSARTLGVASGCYAAAGGLSRIDCDVIDVRQCGVAIVQAPVSDPNLVDRLVEATRASCPKPRGPR
jgi:hypothetical protein